MSTNLTLQPSHKRTFLSQSRVLCVCCQTGLVWILCFWTGTEQPSCGLTAQHIPRLEAHINDRGNGDMSQSMSTWKDDEDLATNVEDSTHGMQSSAKTCKSDDHKPSQISSDPVPSREPTGSEDIGSVTRPSPSKQTPVVRFGFVDIREFSVTVGAMPYSNDTCSLTLTWEHCNHIRKTVQQAEESIKARGKREKVGTESKPRIYFPRRLTLTERRERVAATQGISTKEVKMLEVETMAMRIFDLLSERARLEAREFMRGGNIQVPDAEKNQAKVDCRKSSAIVSITVASSTQINSPGEEPLPKQELPAFCSDNGGTASNEIMVSSCQPQPDCSESMQSAILTLQQHKLRQPKRLTYCSSGCKGSSKVLDEDENRDVHFFL